MATPGQPTKYKPEYDELAHSYCLLGATNGVLAGFFDVAPRPSTIGSPPTPISPTTTLWRCSMPLARACAMPATNRERILWVDCTPE
jgi:hypothetical protein